MYYSLYASLKERRILFWYKREKNSNATCFQTFIPILSLNIQNFLLRIHSCFSIWTQNKRKVAVIQKNTNLLRSVILVFTLFSSSSSVQRSWFSLVLMFYCTKKVKWIILADIIVWLKLSCDSVLFERNLLH